MAVYGKDFVLIERPYHEDPPICQGYMDKKGVRGFSSQMKRRYFVLRGSTLRYYEEKGTIDVRGNKVRSDPNNPKGLELQVLDKTWELLTETEEERDRWLEHLERVSKLQPVTEDAAMSFGRNGADCDHYVEAVHEYQELSPAFEWSPNVRPNLGGWVSVGGQELRSLGTLELPDKGWEWAGDWYVKDVEDNDGWQYASERSAATVWTSQPCDHPIPPYFRRREWNRVRVRNAGAAAATVAAPWRDDLLQKLKAINESLQDFVSSDPSRQWYRWHTACDVCGVGVALDKVTFVCDHKACPSCASRLIRQQEDYNSRNILPRQQDLLRPMAVCPQCYRPTFFRTVRAALDTHEFRTDYRKCLPLFSLHRLHEVYEFERNWTSVTPDKQQWCTKDGTPTALYEIPYGQPWFWVMGWTVDRTSRPVDSQGWEYQTSNSSHQASWASHWSPAPPVLSKLSFGFASIRRRRYVRLEICIRKNEDAPRVQNTLHPVASSINGCSMTSVSSGYSCESGEDGPVVHEETECRAIIQQQWLTGWRELQASLCPVATPTQNGSLTAT